MENIQHKVSVLTSIASVPNTTSEKLLEPVNLKGAKRISNYRLVMGWIMLVLWFSALLAINWDIQWHAVVGRDGFWTPPHWMFYSSVTAAGVLCLFVVLLETILYYRRFPGITDANTTPIVFFFRGPIGFALAGFGMVVMVISAPLDDYWHQLFGIDLAVWTPFHMMLLLGIIMASLGMIYLFTSEMNRRRGWQQPPAASLTLAQRLKSNLGDLFRPAQLGLMLSAVTLTAAYWGAMQPTFPLGTLSIGSLKLPSYSLAVAGVPFLLVALTYATKRVGTATLVGLLFLGMDFATIAFQTWGVQMLAVDQGVPLRRGGANDLQIMPMVYPNFLFLAGLIVDAGYWLTRRWQRWSGGWRVLLVAGSSSLLGGLVLFVLEKPWLEFNALLAKNILLASRQFRPDYWQALPLVLVIGFVAGLAGWVFAAGLRYTDR